MSFKILIVDDSPIVRAVLEKTIRLAEIEVDEFLTAANGQEALNVLDDNWVDIIFLDINMPVMNGVEMVQRMSENGTLNEIPVIVVSTEGSATRIDNLKKMGVNAYIRKPFKPEEIKSVVDEVTGVNNAT